MKDQKTNTSSHILAAASLLAAAAAYYSGNFLLFTAGALLAIVMYNRTKTHTQEKSTEKVYFFLAAAAVIFAAARFYRIFSYPCDFVADEWNQILDAYYVIKGDKSLFEYGKRFGSSFVYLSEIVIMMVISLCRENIDFLRLIPAGVFIFTAVGMFYLGETLKDKKTGIVFAFVYCTSGWALFLSKQVMENVYVPLFCVWLLYFFFKFLKSRKTRYLAAAGLILPAGLFTYSSWVLMLFFSVYVLAEYRKELGKNKILAAAGYVGCICVFYIWLVLNNRHAVAWVQAYTLFSGPAEIFRMFGNLKNAFTYFTQPLETTMSFISSKPLYTFTEFVFLAGGIAQAALQIKDRTKRVFAAGFIMSLATLIISKNPDHNLRHVLILPFAAILSAMFADTMIKWRYFYAAAAMHVMMTFNVYFYHYTEWGTQLNVSGIRRQIAEHINQNYGSGGAFYFFDLLSASSQPLPVRIKSCYLQPKDVNPDKTVFVVNSFWRKGVKNLFPGAEIRYFYGSNQGPNIPLCVFEVEKPKVTAQFMEMEAVIKTYCVKMWMLNPEWIIINQGAAIIKTPFDVLREALKAYYIYTAFGMLNMEEKKYGYTAGLPGKILINAELTYYLGVKSAEQGRYKDAIYQFTKTAAAVPEWPAAYMWLRYFKEKGVK